MEQGPYPHRDAGSDPKMPPLLVFFEEKAVKNELESERQGSPIYETAVFLRIVVPGAKNSFPIYEITRIRHDGTEKVDAQNMRRFKAVYEEWKEKRAPSTSGTPLEQWPLMDVAMIAKFKDCGVYTVQQLATLSEGAFDNVKVGKLYEWRSKAQSWLDEAGDAAGRAEMRAELAKRDAQIAELKEQIARYFSNQNQPAATEGFRRKRKAGDDEIPLSMPEPAAEPRL